MTEADLRTRAIQDGDNNTIQPPTIGVAELEFRRPRTIILRKPSDFKRLRQGFHRMRAISFVSDPSLLLRMLESEGYEEIELVVGEEHKLLKAGLIAQGIDVVERINAHVQRGSLRLLVPKGRTVMHTKFYIFEGKAAVRVILGSLNLTDSSQYNTVRVADFPADDPDRSEAEEIYAAHRTECEPFLGDFFERCRELEVEERRKLIAKWIEDGGETGGGQDIDVALSIYGSLLRPPEGDATHIVQLDLPASASAGRRFEKFIEPVVVGHAAGKPMVRWDAYLGLLHKKTGFPLLVVHPEERVLEVPERPLAERIRSAPLPRPDQVNAALQNIEDYCNSVDFARSSNPEFDKKAVLESLLYVLFSPFAHEYMKARRVRFGYADQRGPRLLYIYGPSFNGKSTFLRYALRLITGQPVEPATAKSFKENTIAHAKEIGSVFPLAFDDAAIPKKGSLSNALKSYWEGWWRDDLPQPQILLTSNSTAVENWAKTRVKRIDFMFQFSRSAGAKERLARIMEFDNQIFCWFSHVYLAKWIEGAWRQVSDEDELFLARTVLKGLYEYSGRNLPLFFPHDPVDLSSERARRRWRGLLFDIKPAKASYRDAGDAVFVEFAGDVRPEEIDSYLGDLPPEISPEKTGNRIKLQPAEAFFAFLEERRRRRVLPGFGRRLLGRSP
jgi:hypothetical protein